MSTKQEFVNIVQSNYGILCEYFDPPRGFLNLKRPTYSLEEAKVAFEEMQKAIKENIKYDEKSDRYSIFDIKFAFQYDPKQHDTILLYDLPDEFDENFQLISFELDRIFPEQLEGNWLVTTYKIVTSDDTITLYNHNENFDFNILLNIFTKDILDMTLEEASILQYVVSWIVICIQYEEADETSRSNFIEILMDHAYDDIDFYTERDFAKALKALKSI